MGMEFLGNKVKRGDELTLQRGKSRVTVDFYDSFTQHGAVVGFVDSTGQSWPLANAASMWEIVGHTEITPSVVPTTRGVYRAVSDDGEDVLVFEENTWMYGGYSVGEADLASYTEFIPLYATGEHFTALSSDGSQYYDLVRFWDADENGDWFVTCTCKGYHFRKQCKHSDELAFHLTEQEKRANA